MKPIRIVLADDHALVRAGMRTLCESLDSITVVAEAADGNQALEMVKAHQPDLVLMDITMKTLNGLEATAQIKREFPQVRVIILSMHTAEDYVHQALKAGAAGYLLKDAAVPELETAITAVMRGEVYLSPQISKLVVQSYVEHAGAVEGPLGMLTPRQREILQLIAEGHGTKDIGFRLKLSVKTVEAHRTQIMERLGIHDIAGLVRFAIRVGLVSSDK
ncbi:MAG: response regulator transcription factor [Pseudomonadota bacterium]